MNSLLSLIAFFSSATLLFILTPNTLIAQTEWHYPFDNNATEASGNQNGTLVDAPASIANRLTQNDQAYTFDGSNDGITIPFEVMNNTVSGTIALWIKYDDFGGQNARNRTLIAKAGNANSQFGLYCRSSRFIFESYNNGSGNFLEIDYNFGSNPDFSDDNWHHLAVTFSATEAKLYVDGALRESDNTTNGTYTLSSTNPISVGAPTNGQDLYFEGEMDELRLYNQVISHEEIIAIGDGTTFKSIKTSIGHHLNHINGVIDSVNHMVGVAVEHLENTAELTFELHTDATASITSGTTSSIPTNITITDADGDAQIWSISALDFEGDILSFSIPSQVGQSIINTTDHTVTLQMPYGGRLDQLTPSIGISPSASISPLSGTEQNFSNPVTYTVTSLDLEVQDWIVNASLHDGVLANYSLDGGVQDASIFGNDGTSIGSPFYTTDRFATATNALSFDGTDDYVNTGLMPELAGSLNAFSVNFWMRTSNSTEIDRIFGTNNTSTSQYLFLSLNQEGAGVQAGNLTFNIRDLDGDTYQLAINDATLNNGNWHMVTLLVNDASTGDVDFFIDGEQNIAETETKSGATDNFGSFDNDFFIGALNAQGAPSDFFTGDLDQFEIINHPITQAEIDTRYLAENWMPTDILSFEIPSQVGTSVINAVTHTIDVELPYGTTNATPVFTLSQGATSVPMSGVERDFSDGETYTITAADGHTTQDWTVNVTIAPNTETDILSFSFLEDVAIGPSVIDAANHTVLVRIFDGVEVDALAPTITLSDQATISPASGNTTDFTNEVTFTVTAGDNGITQDWVVRVDTALKNNFVFYPMTGNFNDASGNDLHGSSSNSPVLTLDRYNTADAAYEFSANNHIINVSSELLNGSLQGTMAAWVKFSNISQGGSGTRTIIGKGGSTDSQFGLFANNNAFIFEAYNNGSGNYLEVVYDFTTEGISDYSDGEWHHVAATFSQTEAKLYVDGILKGSDATTNGTYTHTSTNQFTIGKWGNNQNDPFVGAIDEVVIANRVYSVNEILGLIEPTHFLSFSLPGALSTTFIENNKSNPDTIVVVCPATVNATNLAPIFELLPGAQAKIGEVVQTSGGTPKDFLSELIYTVGNGSISQDWVVRVDIPPTLNTISANSADTTFSINITGTNFGTDSEVYFGGVKANTTSVSRTELSVEVPLGASHAPVSVLTRGLYAEYSQDFNLTFDSPDLDTLLFDKELLISQPTASQTVRIADFDLDGFNDVLTSKSGKISIARNTTTQFGMGNLTLGTPLEIVVSTTQEGVDIGDFNGDGLFDIAAISGDNFVKLVTIFLNNSSGQEQISFDHPIQIEINSPYNRLQHLLIDDLNNDGKMDIITTNDGSVIVTQNLGMSGGQLVFAPSVEIDHSIQGYFTLKIADLDNDGRKDLALFDDINGFSVLLNTTPPSGTISFASGVSVTNPGDIQGFSFCLADFDGDNRRDIAITDYDLVSVLPNTSTLGNVSFGTSIDLPKIEEQYGPIEAGDLDGDGKVDLIASTYLDPAINYAGALSLYKNTSVSGTISFENEVLLPRNDFPVNDLAIIDLDNDTRPEIVGVGSNKLLLLSNTKTDKELFALDIPGQVSNAFKNLDTNNSDTVAIVLPYGTDVSSLKPLFLVSPGATISPDTTVARDFSDLVTYTITAEDESAQDWVVNVEIAPNTDASITDFSITGQVSAMIMANDPVDSDTVNVIVPCDVALSSLTPSIILSAGATVSPDAGLAQDFSAEFTYTVTAEDGSTIQDWIINVTNAPDTVWYADSDGDGFGDANDVITQCNQPENYVLDASDCEDSDVEQFPSQSWFPDNDGDGFGDANYREWTAYGSGLNNTVWAIAEAGNDVYVGGDFTTAGGQAASRIAKWNKVTETWTALGSGLNNSVRSILIDGDDVYVGGFFTNADGIGSADYIAKWNAKTETWSALGIGTNYRIYSLAIHGSTLFAGGSFGTAGGTSSPYLASYDLVSEQWNAIDGTNSNVFELQVQDDLLYVGGTFTNIGGVSANRIASYDIANDQWSALGSGVNSTVWSIETQGTDVFVGGEFSTAEGASALRIAKWNSSTENWSPLGSGFTGGGAIYDLAITGNNLYAGGNFHSAGGVSSLGIAEWNLETEQWSALDGALNNYAYALSSENKQLYIGGIFSQAASTSHNRFTSYGGKISCIQPSGFVLDNTDCDDNEILVNPSNIWYADVDGDGYGDINDTGIASCEQPVGYVTDQTDCNDNNREEYPGQAWYVDADGDGYGDSGTSLVQCSQPTGYVLDNTDCNDLDAGELIGQSWFPDTDTDGFGDATYREWTSYGSGLNGTVWAIAEAGNDIYVGGEFTTAGGQSANRIAKWNKVTETWTALGSGLNNSVRSILIDGVDVFVGGFFTNADGISTADYIAKWDTKTETWSSLGSGTNWYIYSLALHGSTLYAGGIFTQAGGTSSPYLASYDLNTEKWNAIAGTNYQVYELRVQDDLLYVGGAFTSIGGISANRIASYDIANDQWSALGSGVNSYVWSIETQGADVFVGGQFNQAGGESAYNVAKWDTNSSSWSSLNLGVYHNSTTGIVYDLAISDNKLYAGGIFNNVGNEQWESIVGIAEWDLLTEQWSALDGTINGYAYALSSENKQLYMGGTFTQAASTSHTRFTSFGGRVSCDRPEGFIVDHSDCDDNEFLVNPSTVWYADLDGDGYGDINGTGITSCEQPVGYVIDHTDCNDNNGSEYPGQIWYADTDGDGYGDASNTLTQCEQPNGYILDSSDCEDLDEVQFPGQVWYPDTDDDGFGDASYTEWTTYGSGLNGIVEAIVDAGNAIYIGGSFTTAGGQAANRIVRWNKKTESWSSLGSGLNGTVRAILVKENDVYVGGDFSLAGDNTALRIAKWNTQTSSWSSLGDGTNSSVYALALHESKLYVGGAFTTAGGSSSPYLAEWNRDNEAWTAISGTTGPILDLEIANDKLYAGGAFLQIGGVIASRVAQYSFTNMTWSPMGTGVNATALSIATHGSDVFIGGDFWSAGGESARRAAKWDSSLETWTPMSLNGEGENVFDIAVVNQKLYAAAEFSIPSGNPFISDEESFEVVEWNMETQEWFSLESSPISRVYSLGEGNNLLQVGGHSVLSSYGGKVSCTTPTGFVSNNLDCDDQQALIQELCANVWDGTSWTEGAPPTATDDAIIAGNYTFSVDGAFVVNNLTVNTDKSLTVDGEGTLDVKGNLINDGVLTIESGASLITYAGNTISNNILIKRNTRYADGKYSFVGSPMKIDEGVKTASLGPIVYTYNEMVAYGNNEGLNRWIWQNTNEIMIPAKGYAQANKQLIEFTGRPNDGTVTIPGTYTGTPNDAINDATEGWNLVANPYPAAIFIDDFLDANTNTTGAVYLWDDNGSETVRGSNADYIVANKSGATDNNGIDNDARWNNHIGSAQGFFVKLNNGAGDITFTEAMRRSSFNADDNFFRKAEKPIIRLNLTHDDGLQRQAIVGWNDAVANEVLTAGYDAKVFNPTADYLIYTQKANEALAIQTVNSQVVEISVGIRVAEAGTYALSFKLEHLAGQALYLLDKETGERVLANAYGYTFTLEQGETADRFVLTTLSGALALDELSVNIYTSEKVLYIETGATAPTYYQVYNLAGVRMKTILVNRSTMTDLDELAVGIYLVTDGVTSRKVILK